MGCAHQFTHNFLDIYKNSATLISMNSEINLAYKCGVLEGTIKSFSYRFSIPGVEITNHQLFTDFLYSEIERANESAKEYSDMISSK